jgi:hypothetical protein
MQKETGEQETEESQLEVDRLPDAERILQDVCKLRRLSCVEELCQVRLAMRGACGEISPKEEASFPRRFRAEASPVTRDSPSRILWLLKIFGG